MLTAEMFALPERKAVRAASHAEEILRRYDEVDAQLVAAGFPVTSPWWRATIQRWYESGKRQLVARVGRRGGKSSSLSRLAVVEALYGHHDVPPGDVGFVGIVSIDRNEAMGRLRTVEAILTALGVAFRPCRGGVQGIELLGRRTGFRVFTASIGGVSGFTAIFILGDEVAKWRDNDTGANPATQVLSSVRPTMRTQKNARMVLSSSPFGMMDAHYDAFELGETDGQITAFAETWIANPTVTEDECRADEPDETAFLREYAAIPQAEVESSLLTSLLVERATRPEAGDLPHIEGVRHIGTMDPGTRSNAWTFVIARQDHKGVRHVVLAREWQGSPSKPLDPALVLAEISILATRYEAGAVFTDQHSVDALRALARERGLGLIEAPWTVTSKREAYEGLRNLMLAGRVSLPPDPQVRVDLLGIVKRITRTGVTYELATVNGRHSDYAPAIALAVADARYASKEPEEEQTIAEKAHEAKVTFLKGLQKERQKAQRYGRPPATHRAR